MGMVFSADEVFAMAIEMETNGAEFYRRAADLQGDDAARDYFLGLMKMEEGHKMTFELLRKEFAASDAGATTDSYDEGGQYLSAIVGGNHVEGAPSVTELLTGSESMADVVQTAIGLEKEAILFYLGLMDMVPETLGKLKIEFIISEEKKHVVTLTAELKKLTG